MRIGDRTKGKRNQERFWFYIISRIESYIYFYRYQRMKRSNDSSSNNNNTSTITTIPITIITDDEVNYIIVITLTYRLLHLAIHVRTQTPRRFLQQSNCNTRASPSCPPPTISVSSRRAQSYIPTIIERRFV